MAEFYLPIKIGQRRMHICHLNNPSVDYGFEFIIPIAGNDIELFSFSHNAKLISTKGTKFNREPTKENFKVEHSDIVNDSLNVKVTMGKGEGIDDTPLQNSVFGISMDRDSHSNFVAKATNLISVKKLNITICYKEKNKEPFKYSFAIHTPKVNEDTKIYKAAIDFGSEASQVGFKVYSGSDKPQFIRLVDTLKEFYHQHNNRYSFWQGRPNDTDSESSRLFKSIFFIHKNPISGYNYADKPNKYQEQTLLQIITPYITATTDPTSNYYTPLFLLPNLKLVELLSDGHFLSDSVQFGDKENNPRNFQGRVNILSDSLVEDYVRIILSYFLYAILECVKAETRSEKYLQITLLMPNVYSQEKVYRIIQNFYKDFNEIVKADDYKNFKGIEVQAMSESDASFIGARVRSNGSVPIGDRISTGVNANYLVIDAGKGTTDFSVIKQQESFVKYDSQFRTGLPGSGQMLSYAFIESIAEMLTGIDLLEMIKTEKDYPEILQFMDYIEQLKKNHTEFKEYQAKVASNGDEETTQKDNRVNENFTRLSKVNEYIKSEFIDKKIRIPNSSNKVNHKVSELVNKIEENIRYSGIENFHQVILAGRAFRFEPLLTAVKNKFDALVSAENKFIFQNSHSKFICIEGAFQAENIHINLNSELIGSPVILDEKYNPYSPKKSFLDRIFPPKSERFIDESFFYNGMKLNYDLNNKTIRIGARDYSPTVNVIEASKKYILYYTGNGFLLQWENGSGELTEKRVSESFTKMVEQTVFPFAYISFGNTTGTNSTTPEKPREKAVEKPKAVEQPKPTETKKQDSQKKSDSDDDVLS
jgi:hypothetical protein